MKNRALDELIENRNKFESEESPTERIQKKRAAALAIVNDFIEKASAKELSEIDTSSMINSPLYDLINYACANIDDSYEQSEIANQNREDIYNDILDTLAETKFTFQLSELMSLPKYREIMSEESSKALEVVRAKIDELGIGDLPLFVEEFTEDEFEKRMEESAHNLRVEEITKFEDVMDEKFELFNLVMER